jgi:hypothetical protein
VKVPGYQTERAMFAYTPTLAAQEKLGKSSTRRLPRSLVQAFWSGP